MHGAERARLTFLVSKAGKEVFMNSNDILTLWCCGVFDPLIGAVENKMYSGSFFGPAGAGLFGGGMFGGNQMPPLPQMPQQLYGQYPSFD